MQRVYSIKTISISYSIDADLINSSALFDLSGQIKLPRIYTNKLIQTPMIACVEDAISHETGRGTPIATIRLYVEKIKPQIIDNIAPIELPFFHKKPKTIGIKAPEVK